MVGSSFARQRRHLNQSHSQIEQRMKLTRRTTHFADMPKGMTTNEVEAVLGKPDKWQGRIKLATMRE